MEQDRQFRYIALELCLANVQDYVQGRYEGPHISRIEVLQQATAGLKHLHQLNIGQWRGGERLGRGGQTAGIGEGRVGIRHGRGVRMNSVRRLLEWPRLGMVSRWIPGVFRFAQ